MRLLQRCRNLYRFSAYLVFLSIYVCVCIKFLLVYCKLVISMMLYRYEFKKNHGEWVSTIKPNLGPGIAERVWEALETTDEKIDVCLSVKAELKVALAALLGVIWNFSTYPNPKKCSHTRCLKRGFCVYAHEHLRSNSKALCLSQRQKVHTLKAFKKRIMFVYIWTLPWVCAWKCWIGPWW